MDIRKRARLERSVTRSYPIKRYLYFQPKRNGLYRRLRSVADPMEIQVDRTYMVHIIWAKSGLNDGQFSRQFTRYRIRTFFDFTNGGPEYKLIAIGINWRLDFYLHLVFLEKTLENPIF